MKLPFNSSLIGFKQLACILVLIGMFIAPIAQTITMLMDTSIEWVDLSDENTSDEEEKQEKEGEDDKKKLQILTPIPYHLNQLNSLLCFEFTKRLFDNNLEILIPPPDLI